ncbi:MAG: peptidoglycan-binding domain-containing protein, partial [Rhodospirillales bacterium]
MTYLRRFRCLARAFPWFLRNQAFPGKGRAGKGHLASPARWRDIFNMDRCFRCQAHAIGFFAAALVGLALAGWGSSARASVGLGELAARPTETLPGGERPKERLANPLVLRVQKALAGSDRYRGPVNGRMNAVLEAAIRAYQKSTGLKVDGQVSEALAGHMETGAKVAGLLKRLQRVRHDNIETARRALLDHPATRRLRTGDDGGTAETADPTRDPTQCFRDPTVRCLLAEASESAKAIYKPEMRDWALGEI